MQRPCWAVLSSQPVLGYASSAWQTDTDAEGSLWTALSCIEQGHPLRAHQGTVTGTAFPLPQILPLSFCFSKRTWEHCMLLEAGKGYQGQPKNRKSSKNTAQRLLLSELYILMVKGASCSFGKEIKTHNFDNEVIIQPQKYLFINKLFSEED